MRRKSARNAAKASPEKSKKAESPTRKTRRSKRRRKSTSSSDSEDDTSLDVIAQKIADSANDDSKQESKSHTPSDEENLSQHSMWTVTTSDEGNEGEIQKLKICLTRPSMSPEKSTRKRKSKSQTEDFGEVAKHSNRKSEDSSTNEEDKKITDDNDETVKGKGKSKTKTKSKIEKNLQLIEPEIETQCEINANVQVTAQSPTIDIPVDNENVKSEVEIVAPGKTDDSNVQNERDIDVNEPEQEDSKEVINDVPRIIDEVIVESVENHTETNTIEESSSEIKNTVHELAETKDLSACIIDTVINEAKIHTVIEEPMIEEVHEQVIIAEETEVASKIEEESIIESKVNEDKEEEVVKVSVSEEQIVNQPNLEIIQSMQPDDEKIEENSEQIENKTEPEETCVSQDQELHSEDASTTKNETVVEDEVQKIIENNQGSPDRGDFKHSIKLCNRTEDKTKSEVRSVSQNQELHNEGILTTQKETSEENNQESVDRSNFKHSEITPKKQRKWNRTSVFEKVISSLVVINTDTIKRFCPNVEFLSESDIKLDSVPPKERRRLLSTDQAEKKLERNISVNSESSKDASAYSPKDKEYEQEDNSNIIALNRKISIVDDTASKLRPPPSPAKNPVSEILFITNLVRPFTLKQLKELLERTGKIKEDGFWTDRIKSKCYVRYETAEEAEATRNAIHGVNWPTGNGKKLIIDYATEEEMENARNPPPPPPPVSVPEVKVLEKENQEPDIKIKKDASPPPREKEREHKREAPVREWDLGKEDFHRERSRSRDRIKHRRPRRSHSPVDDFISRKQRKQEESAPQKLMDDLFQKTKAMPSIYWQPLSPEQIATKQQQRLLRMAEHKRRMEETSRSRGADFGRGGVYRRRYD